MPMRARDLHPLCCLPVDCPGAWCASAAPAGDRSPSPPPSPNHPPTVAGVLHKWTNIGKGWRPRWFVILQGGLLAYSKIRPRATTLTPPAADGGGPRLIGPAGYAAAAEERPVGFVHLKIMVDG